MDEEEEHLQKTPPKTKCFTKKNFTLATGTRGLDKEDTSTPNAKWFKKNKLISSESEPEEEQMNGIKPLESVEHLQTPATVGKKDDPKGSVSSESNMSVSLGDSVLNMSEGTLTKCVEGIVTFLDADLGDLKCGGSGVTNQSAGEKDLPKGEEKPVPMTVALSDGDENSVSIPIQNMSVQAVSDENPATVDEKSDENLPKGDEKPVPMTVSLLDGDEKSHENGNENSVSKSIQNMPVQAASDEKPITVDEKSDENLPKGDEKPVPMTVSLSDGDEKSHKNGNENSVSKPIQNMPVQAASDEKP